MIPSLPIPFVPSGYRNNKYYYTVSNTTGIVFIIFWNNEEERWEMWNENETTIFAHLKNPGNYPESTEQYSWENSVGGINIDITNINDCVPNIYIDFVDLTRSSSPTTTDKAWKQSGITPKGKYNGKPWFISDILINSVEYQFYIIWENGEWQAWSIFDPINGPSGTQYASLSNTLEYPVGDNWVAINDILGYNFYLSSLDPSSLLCFIFIGTDVSSTSQYQTSICGGTYNGKCYYLVPSPDGDDEVYIIWNKITNRWECYDTFDPVNGPSGKNNSGVYGYLNSLNSIPLSTSTNEWKIINNDTNVLYSSLGECQPIEITTTTVSACDSYTWSANGQTYTTSGTYTNRTNTSVQTLILTITASTSTTTPISVCDTYTWPINGQTYTTSGTYTYYDPNTCHTEILELIVTPITTNTTTETAVGSYTWPVNNTVYTQPGTYTFVTPSNPCHTEILNLTITQPVIDATRYTTRPDSLIPEIGNKLYYNVPGVSTPIPVPGPGTTSLRKPLVGTNGNKYIVLLDSNGTITAVSAYGVYACCAFPGIEQPDPQTDDGYYIGITEWVAGPNSGLDNACMNNVFPLFKSPCI